MLYLKCFITVLYSSQITIRNKKKEWLGNSQVVSSIVKKQETECLENCTILNALIYFKIFINAKLLFYFSQYFSVSYCKTYPLKSLNASNENSRICIQGWLK